MLMRTGVMAVSAAVAAMMFGCSPRPSATVAMVKDKIYSVTPAAMKVKSGIVTGELTEMKVTERIEEGSGRITSPAKLSGKLVLKNVSSDQSLRLIGVKVLYIDMQGKPIKLEENRTEPMLRIASSYGSQERLDPGQDSTQTLDADVRVEGLRAVLSGIEPLLAAVRRGDPEHRLGPVFFQLDRLALHVDVEHLDADQAQGLVRRHVLENQLAAELGGRRDASRALLDALSDLHLGELAGDDAGFHLHRVGRHAVDLVLHHCDRRARLRGAAEHHRRHRGAHCHHTCPHQHCLLLAGLLMVLLASLPVGELPLGVFPGRAVGFLDPARENAAPAGDGIELLLAELFPALLGVDLESPPVLLDTVPVQLALLRPRRLSACYGGPAVR